METFESTPGGVAGVNVDPDRQLGLDLSNERNNNGKRGCASLLQQKNQQEEQVQLLLSTIEHLSEHLDLDGQLQAIQQARATLLEEAHARATGKQTARMEGEAKGLQQQLYALTGERVVGLLTAVRPMGIGWSVG